MRPDQVPSSYMYREDYTGRRGGVAAAAALFVALVAGAIVADVTAAPAAPSGGEADRVRALIVSDPLADVFDVRTGTAGVVDDAVFGAAGVVVCSGGGELYLNAVVYSAVKAVYCPGGEAS